MHSTAFSQFQAESASFTWNHNRKLPRRPVDRPVYVPRPTDRIAQMPLELVRSRQAMRQIHINAE